MMWGSLFQSVFKMSLMAGVAVIVVLAARLLLRRAPKIFSYALWAIVLFRLCCPVSVSSSLSLFGVLERALPKMKTETEYLPESVVDPESGIVSDQSGNPAVGVPNIDPVQGVAPEIGTVQQAGSVQGQEGRFPAQTGNNQSQLGNQLTQSENKQPQSGVPVIGDNTSANVTGIGAAWSAENWMDTASWIWVGGMLAMAVYSLVSVLSVRRRLVGAVPLRDNIYVCDYLETPFVMGVFRPRIYLCSTLKEHEMEYIILHEQHHIRRFDHVIKLLAFAVLCVHWFNPLVWVAFILAGKDMEMSCDEAVVKRMGERIRWDYSKSLLVLATGHQSIAGAPLAFGEGSTKGRIHNLLKKKKAGKWLAGVAAVVLVVAGVLLLTDPVGSTAGEPSGDVVNGQFGDDDPSGIENDQDQQTGQTPSGDQTNEAPAETKKEPDQIVVMMDDATRMQAIANSPEWAKEVWEKFNEYEEPVTIWIGDTYAGFMDQVVYDNGNGQKVTKFPAMDYDGDGTLDRIYGDISPAEESIYLFSGNGELLLLGKPYWSFLGSTYSADLTGDGKNELIYITYVMGSGGNTYCVSAWERIDGRWDKMDITPSGDNRLDDAGNLHTLTLPIQVEKTGENRIRLTQPDVGKSFEHEVKYGYMSTLWPETREDNKPYVTEIYSKYISVVNDPDTGKSVFLVSGGYGDKWYKAHCKWLLGYEDGEWKILDFWDNDVWDNIEGEKTLKQKMTDVLWQRMVSMVLDLAPSDRDDWLAYWSGESQVEMILGNFDEEYHQVYTEGKDNPWGRSYQVNAAYDRDKAYNTGWYWNEHYRDLSVEELYENADKYLGYSYSHHGAYYYSEDLFAKHRSEGLLMVTGSLKREIYPAGETFLNQREIEGEYIDLWNAVMGAVSELYLEELGGIPERMAGEAYLMGFDPETLTAEFWICLEERTLYMTANYTVESCGWTWKYEGDKSYFDPGYVYGFDENYVFPGGWNEENISQSAWLGLEFDLTTERLAE